jgi:hypothetical protein
MFGHGRQAHAEGFRKLVHGGSALGEARQNGAPGGIGESAECGIEHLCHALLTICLSNQ